VRERQGRGLGVGVGGGVAHVGVRRERGGWGRQGDGAEGGVEEFHIKG
jgi:hypothetical protein